ncbi:MAG: hypothetical protein OXJ55_11235, partial [Caldilineaceae bacterium]|nr:hypothetical protein [Caldilineaceae bacterium]
VIAPMPVITIRFILTFLLHPSCAMWESGRIRPSQAELVLRFFQLVNPLLTPEAEEFDVERLPNPSSKGQHYYMLHGTG